MNNVMTPQVTKTTYRVEVCYEGGSWRHLWFNTRRSVPGYQSDKGTFTTKEDAVYMIATGRVAYDAFLCEGEDDAPHYRVIRVDIVETVEEVHDTLGRIPFIPMTKTV